MENATYAVFVAGTDRMHTTNDADSLPFIYYWTGEVFQSFDVKRERIGEVTGTLIEQWLVMNGGKYDLRMIAGPQKWDEWGRDIDE